MQGIVTQVGQVRAVISEIHVASHELAARLAQLVSGFRLERGRE
jgi:hypothetical protein